VNSEVIPKKLPWWTWIAPLFLIELGDQISLYFQYSFSSTFYIPTSIAVILIHWWGPKRVMPAVFLISTFNNYFYGIETVWVWFMMGLGDSIGIYSSWFLFSYLYKGKYHLPDTRNTVAFASLGLLIPILISTLSWQIGYIADGKLLRENFFWQFNRDLIGELIVHSILVLPALYYLSPILSRKKLTLNQNIKPPHLYHFSKRSLTAIFLMVAITITTSFVLEFDDFWFVFGLISLFVAIQFGFGAVILVNILIFVLTYLPPAINSQLFSAVDYKTDEQTLRTFFGYFLLYVFSSLTGRVISDLRQAKDQLKEQNKELIQTNTELDRFVYSVSHDLTAPLKSILGLVNVSRMTNPSSELISYLNKIQTSVLKLDGFIKDILDYSRNNRTEIKNENIDVKEICSQILESLKFHNTYQNTVVDLSGLDGVFIQSDRSRLYIILNNIITNAIKYQKKDVGHHPVVKVSSRKTESSVSIIVEDNGSGIPQDVLPNIFRMFYRGSLDSQGSGLGLYIAKEACEKIEGRISVESEFGQGTTFTISLKSA
jgi:signal transduction histidine kinase